MPYDISQICWQVTLWLFNIAMENGTFIDHWIIYDDFTGLKHGDFPVGKPNHQRVFDIDLHL